jgi:hypothetical protein
MGFILPYTPLWKQNIFNEKGTKYCRYKMIDIIQSHPHTKEILFYELKYMVFRAEVPNLF